MKANTSALSLRKDERAQLVVGGAIVAGFILLAVGVVVMANTIPTAITEVESANTTTWSAGAVGLWAILGLIIVAVVVLVLLRIGGLF